MKHEKDTGDSEDDEEEAGDSSETEGIGESKTVAFHLGREDMEKEVVIHYHGSFQIGIRYSSSEDGSPKC
jgi:FKBP-type peptidyl-prolyl cis-trans isomerase